MRDVRLFGCGGGNCYVPNRCTGYRRASSLARRGFRRFLRSGRAINVAVGRGIPVCLPRCRGVSGTSISGYIVGLGLGCGKGIRQSSSKGRGRCALHFVSCASRKARNAAAGSVIHSRCCVFRICGNDGKRGLIGLAIGG